MASEILPARAAEILDDLTAIVARACAKISALSQEELMPRMKANHSPVTAADEAAEVLIAEGVGRLLPAVPVVSEESADQHHNHLDGSFLIVDPLDGTREFLAGRDEFTVNLAIITRGVPIAGIISPTSVDAPASILLIAGVALGGRSSLLGPMLGAIAVGYGRSALSEHFPNQWTYFQGALFIVVVLLLPGGVASLGSKVRSLWSRLRSLRPSNLPAASRSRAGTIRGARPRS